MSFPSDPSAPPPPPDGDGGEQGPRRYPSTIGGACYIAVLLTAVTALVITTQDWRVGVRVLAGALGASALLRLVLPQRDAGMLAVRHRLLDVVMVAALAAVLWWLAGSIPDQPGAP